MRRRLYFILPNIKEGEAIVDDLLLKRIPITRIHVIAKEGTDLGTLPEATVLQKNDILHSILVGLGAGAIFGIIAGIIAHIALGFEFGGGLLLAMILGAILGAWAASMIGMMVPNVHLKQFQDAIKHGNILMMVDVAKERVHEIETEIMQRHPNADYKGIEPTIPGFP